jgi:oligopeptidase A
VPKMADTPEQVLAFLRDLAQGPPFAERDWPNCAPSPQRTRPGRPATLGPCLGLGKAQAAALQLLRPGSEAVLPEPKVLAGLFRVIETLFGVTAPPDEAPVWHPDVRFFRIERGTARADRPVLPRPVRARTKRPAPGWTRRITRRAPGGVQTPVAYLNCNFPAPVGGKPTATFTHDDVITLFHEFGHGLHHMLTQVDELPVSGISRRRMGCGRAAQPVHGELLLGMGRAAAA